MRLGLRLSCFLALVGLSVGGCDDDPVAGPPPAFRFAEVGSAASPGRAVAEGPGGLYVAFDTGLSRSTDGGRSFETLAAAGLPPGHINTLSAFEGDALVAYVWGKGLYRSADGGQSFEALPPWPTYDVLGSLITPRAKVVPYNGNVDRTNASRGVLAGPGGVYLTEDAGASWELIQLNVGDGKFYALFIDADVAGDTVVAAALSPSTLLPPTFSGLVGGGVLLSRDGGASWESIHGDLPLSSLTGVSIGDDGTIFASGIDGGVYRHDGEGKWTSLDGPKDVLELSPAAAGVSAGTGTRGVWRYEPAGWSAAGDGAVTDLTRNYALTYDGKLYELEPGIGEAPREPAGGTVHLSFSFHVNLYHSFRGDAPDETGYGLDIEIIRNTLDWLDKYPDVHADWDMENYFSVDGWLATDAPDILARVKERVESGQDQVRLMSWNNGAMSASTFEEFEAAVERGNASNLAAFGSIVPGVQPQENMFSPDHVTWYPQLGIEWITFFNSQSPFTGFPLDHRLAGIDAYQVATLSNGDDEMLMIPVYNHADVFDHGSLRAWLTQISDTYAGDTLLAIHFDADSETWINFDGELANIQDLEFVRYTNLQTYIDGHEPSSAVTLEGDQADGIGDGYQSWAEKDINHEIYTQVAIAREHAAWARAIAPGDATVEGLVEDALTPRLLTLSTTNFGLASPYLAPDREVSARSYAAESVSLAKAAFDAAVASNPVADGTIELVNARDSSGPALVEIALAVPAAVYTDPSPLAIFDGATELAATVDAIDNAVDPVLLRASVVVDVDANSDKSLTWTYDPANPSTATGGAAAADLDASSIPLEAPFTECLGSGRADAMLDDAGTAVVDARGASVELIERYDLPFCDGVGTTSRTLTHYAGLEGIVVAVDAEMANLESRDDAESVALTPLGCPADVATIQWRTFGGITRSRASRPLQESWNGQSADGWVAYSCVDGPTVQIAHRVLERTSIAFSPMRNDDGRAIFAPLGTLWGDTPWHFGRASGGVGVGDIVGIITPQFNPAAPDWSGKTVRYRLLVGEGIAEDSLDLFAHPPLVRAGAYVAP